MRLLGQRITEHLRELGCPLAEHETFPPSRNSVEYFGWKALHEQEGYYPFHYELWRNRSGGTSLYVAIHCEQADARLLERFKGLSADGDWESVQWGNAKTGWQIRHKHPFTSYPNPTEDSPEALAALAIPAAQMLKEAYDRYQTQLAEIWTATYSTSASPSFEMDPIPGPLNQIFYGPPGTGKTYKLQKLQDHFTVAPQVQTQKAYLAEVVKDYYQWQVLGAALKAADRPVPVSELAANPLIKAAIPGTDRTPSLNIIWSNLLRLESKENQSNIFKRSPKGWTIEEKPEEFGRPIPDELLKVAKNPNVVPNQGNSIKNYNFITFHQRYSYDDFIEGIRPNVEAEDLVFAPHSGPFMEACLSALRLAGYTTFREAHSLTKEEREQTFAAIAKDPTRQYALLIDEINRANMSAVFGELITLIEEDKRMGQPHELWVQLPSSGISFCVPPNLYILGTMNTADKSIALVDIALRRRFHFEAMYPQYDIEGMEVHRDLLRALNKAIVVDHKKSPDFMIGHAFFIGKALTDQVDILNRKVIPLLMEYFPNKPETVKDILAKAGVTVEPPTLENGYQIKVIQPGSSA